MTFESDILPEEWARAAQTLKGQFMRNGLWHLKALDPRSITVLQMNGLLKTVQTPELSEQDIAVLHTCDHPDRLPILPGPMLAYFEEGDRSQAVLRHVEDLVFDADLKVRIAALAHFERLAETVDPPLLTTRTKSIISRYACDLQSEDNARWRPASVAIADRLRDDFYCNLAGVRQCIELRTDDTRYTPRILYPSTLALDGTDVRIWRATCQEAEIRSRICSRVAESASLREACNSYYREFGYLPLDESISIVALIDEWLRVHHGGDEVWSEVWVWADQIPSPLARYHATMVFVRRPDLVPEGKQDELWHEVSEVVHAPSTDDSESSWSQAWYLRCELARHYVRHMESHFPGQDGELIAGLSWWFAEQVSLLFGKAPEVIHHVMLRVIRPAAEHSELIWQLAHPPIAQSSLRSHTLYLRSVWSLSLLCAMDKLLQAPSNGLDGSSHMSTIDEAMNQAAIESFPMQEPLRGNPTFAFDRSLLPTAEIWLEISSRPGELSILSFLADAVPKVADLDWLGRALKELPMMDAGNQVMITSVIRRLAFVGTLLTDAIWDSLCNPEWAKDVLLKLDLSAIETLFQALTEVQAQEGSRWLAQVPHFFAQGCEAVGKDSDRQRLLFSLIVVSSTNGGTSSAIRRLLRGKYKQRFVKHNDLWRRQLDGTVPLLPAWVQAKVRATMASMHIG